MLLLPVQVSSEAIVSPGLPAPTRMRLLVKVVVPVWKSVPLVAVKVVPLAAEKLPVKVTPLSVPPLPNVSAPEPTVPPVIAPPETRVKMPLAGAASVAAELFSWPVILSVPPAPLIVPPRSAVVRLPPKLIIPPPVAVSVPRFTIDAAPPPNVSVPPFAVIVPLDEFVAESLGPLPTFSVPLVTLTDPVFANVRPLPAPPVL